jgi:opacity protein-like surface antigen
MAGVVSAFHSVAARESLITTPAWLIRRPVCCDTFLLNFDGQADQKANLGDDEWTGFGTAQLAYDQRFGQFLVGALVDFDFYPDEPGNSSSSSIDGSFDITLSSANLGNLIPPGTIVFPVPDYALASSNIELENVWSIGGRLGYIVSPALLVYGLGGYTEASLDGSAQLSFTTVLAGDQTLKLDMPDELHGFFVGGGGEYKFTNSLALRLEYRFAKYQSEGKSTSFDVSQGFPFGGFNLDIAESGKIETDIDAEIHTVRGALVMKLGTP